jgi:hypothetical protein
MARSTQIPSTDIVEIEHRIGKDRDLLAGLSKVDCQLLAECTSEIKAAFARLWAFEKSNDPVSVKASKDICFAAMAIAFRHLDATGVSHAVGRLSSHAADFNFVQNLPALAFDHAYLTQTLRVPEAKALKFWHHVDAHRPQFIKRMTKADFAFEPLMVQVRRGFDSPKGEAWQHMSPGIWTKIAGGALAAVNVAGAVGAITGIGLGVAVLSCLAGSGGIFID